MTFFIPEWRHGCHLHRSTFPDTLRIIFVFAAHTASTLHSMGYPYISHINFLSSFRSLLSTYQLRWSQRKLASLQFFNGVTFPLPLDAQLAYSPVKTHSPFASGRHWQYCSHNSRKRLCPSMHVGNAQYDSKLSWLDSWCLTDCPTSLYLCVFIGLPEGQQFQFWQLGHSPLNVSFCVWPEFQPLINYQLMNNPSASKHWLHTVSLLYPNCSLGTPYGLYQTSQRW